MKPILLLTFVLLCLSTSATQAQDTRVQLQQIANDLSKQISTKGKSRVVISSFLDLNNQETQLGRYMADKFTIGMMKAGSLSVVDRSQLAQLMRDNKLGAERVLDPKTIPILGKLTGGEVIITGNYTALDNTVDITVKAIDLERGLNLAVAEGNVPRTPEINKLLTEMVTTAGGTSEGSGSSPSAGPQTSNSTPANLPKPAADCAAKSICVICATNKSAVDIKASVSMWFPTYYVHPNETKCWQEFPINKSSGFEDGMIQYFDDSNTVLKEDRFVAEACKVYNRVFTK